jgi:hypothetical protein
MAESKLSIAGACEAREDYLRTKELRSLKAVNPRAVRACVAPGCTAPSLLGKGRRAVLWVTSVTGNDPDSVVRGQRVNCSCGCPSMFWDAYADMCGGAKPEIWIRGVGKTTDREFAREPREADFAGKRKAAAPKRKAAAPKRKGGKSSVAKRRSRMCKVNLR